MNKTSLDLLEELKTYNLEVHTHVAKEFLNTSALYPVDLLATAVVDRSLNLVDAFVTLMERPNFVAAVPLLRLQIDNCLRFYAIHLVEKPHEFALQVLEGDQINRMKDRNNQKMTDRHLLNELSQQEQSYNWIPDVYENTSGYVHLSEKHIYNSIKFSDESDDTGVLNLESKVRLKDEYIPDEAYEEVIQAFIAATKILFNYVQGWAATKA